MNENNEQQIVAPPAPAATTRRRWWLVAAGFIGWYLANGLFWVMMLGKTKPDFSITSLGDAMFVNLLMFPFNIILLLMLAIIRPTRSVALGILLAIALNLVISLFSMLIFNAVCLVPFFIR